MLERSPSSHATLDTRGDDARTSDVGALGGGRGEREGAALTGPGELLFEWTKISATAFDTIGADVAGGIAAEEEGTEATVTGAGALSLPRRLAVMVNNGDDTRDVGVVRAGFGRGDRVTSRG